MVEPLVRNWMSSKVISIGPKTTLPEAHKLMKEHRLRRLPVLDHGHLIGIVTLGDLREASPSTASALSVYEMNYLLAQLTIDQVMTRDPFTVSPGSPMRDAARLMLEHKIGGLPVVESGQVVGMITESDIFRVLVKELD